MPFNKQHIQYKEAAVMVSDFLNEKVLNLPNNTFDMLCANLENLTSCMWDDVLFYFSQNTQDLKINDVLKTYLTEIAKTKDKNILAGNWANLQRTYNYYYNNPISDCLSDFISFSKIQPGDYLLENSATGMGKSHIIHENILDVLSGRKGVDFQKIMVLSYQYRHHLDLLSKLEANKLPHVIVTGGSTLFRHQIEFQLTSTKLKPCPSTKIKNILYSDTKKKVFTLSNADKAIISAECFDSQQKKACNRCDVCMYKNPVETADAIRLDTPEKPVVMLTSVSKLMYGLKNKDTNISFFSDNPHPFFHNTLFVVEEMVESFKNMILNTVEQKKLLSYIETLQNKQNLSSFDTLNYYIDEHINISLQHTNANKTELQDIRNLFTNTLQNLNNVKIEYFNGQHTLYFDKPILISSDFVNSSGVEVNKRYVHSQTNSQFNHGLKILYADFQPKIIELNLRDKGNNIPIYFDRLSSSFVMFIKKIFQICNGLVDKMNKYTESNDNYKFFHIKALEILYFMMIESIQHPIDGEWDSSGDDENGSNDRSFENFAFIKFLLSQDYDHKHSDLELFLRNGLNISELYPTKPMRGMIERHEINMKFNTGGANFFFKNMRKKELFNALLACSASLGINSLLHQPSRIYMTANEPNYIKYSPLNQLLQDTSNLQYTKDFRKNFKFEIVETSGAYKDKRDQKGFLAKFLTEKKNDPIVGLLITNSKAEAKSMKKFLDGLSNDDVACFLIEDSKNDLKNINVDISKTFFEKKKTKIFVIGHYQAIAAGVNFGLEIPKKYFKSEVVKKYIGHLEEIYYLKENITVDLNFLMFINSKTHALDDELKGLLLNTISGDFSKHDIQKYLNTSDAIACKKYVKQSYLARQERFDWFFQSVGRINRNFNSPKETNVILDADFYEEVLLQIDWKNYVLNTPFWNLLESFILKNKDEIVHQDYQWENPLDKLNLIYKLQPGFLNAFIRSGSSEYDWAESLRLILASIAIKCLDNFKLYINESWVINGDESQIINLLHLHLEEFNKKFGHIWNVSFYVKDFIQKNPFDKNVKNVYVNNDFICTHQTNFLDKMVFLQKIYKNTLLHHDIVLNIVKPFISEQEMKKTLYKNTITVPNQLNELADVYIEIKDKKQQDWICAIDVKNYNIDNTVNILNLENINDVMSQFNNIDSKINEISKYYSNQKLNYIIALNNKTICSSQKVWCLINGSWMSLQDCKQQKLTHLIDKLLTFLTYQQIYEYRINSIISQI